MPLVVVYLMGWHDSTNMPGAGYIDSWMQSVTAAEEQGFTPTVFRIPRGKGFDRQAYHKAVEDIEKLLQDRFGMGETNTDTALLFISNY